MKKLIPLALLAIFTLPLAGQAFAAETSFSDTLLSKAVDRATANSFSADEINLIKEYMKGGKATEKKSKYKKNKHKNKKERGLPPGLAKREQLPPGLAKQLEKNGRLPPGLEKQALPDDLLLRLPSCKGNSIECALVGDRVVLIDKTTDLVLDLIEQTVTK